MALPKDPIMLMSFVNTQLRDHYDSLASFAGAYMVEEEEIIQKLEAAGYVYDEENNRFAPK